jgi:hypothetical protein
MFIPLNVRQHGSPGYDLEDDFDSMLCDCYDLVDYHEWRSEHKKSIFDFSVISKGGNFLIDVVGYGLKYHSISLYTHHKSWSKLLDYADSEGVDRCYLAYKPYEYHSDSFLDWRFLKITDDLPEGNLYISRSRAVHSKTYKYLFADKRNIKTILSEKVKGKYALRKEAERKLDAWIYGDARA